MQARTKLQKKFIKEVPNYCKLQVTFKSCYDFHFRGPVVLTSSVVYAMNPIMENVLDTSL